MVKSYLDYQISGTTRGEVEVGAILFEDGKLVQIKDRAISIGCYGNCYSSRDYMELNIATFDIEKPNVLFYKIDRDIDYENKNTKGVELKLSIPNHLIGQTEQILDLFDDNSNDIKYSENNKIQYGDIEDFLTTKENAEKLSLEHTSTTLKELLQN